MLDYRKIIKNQEIYIDQNEAKVPHIEICNNYFFVVFEETKLQLFTMQNC